MSKSIDRVKHAASALGLDIEILQMNSSTRTAQDAAHSCNCHISQIVKSMVFQTDSNKGLILLLISGDKIADLKLVESQIGSSLVKADPKVVRTKTGFSIGGVSPVGHKNQIDTYMDPSLLKHSLVWAAAGTPNAVFSVDPQTLRSKIGAQVLDAI